MRKIILYIACSLDGKIARKDGDVHWLEAIPNPEGLDHGYGNLLSRIDTTFMGNSTYKVVMGFDMEWPYGNLKNYVFTRDKDLLDDGRVQYVHEDIAHFAARLKETEGKDIWLIGGGEINTILANAGLIDEIILSVAPKTLGEGIPLFSDGIKEQDFVLVDAVTWSSGFVTITYHKK